MTDQQIAIVERSSGDVCQPETDRAAENTGADGELPCLSLADLSPSSYIPKDWWLVVLKAHFDGAQTADNTRVTLACICGTADEWTPIELAWRQVISDHKAPPLHTTNANALQKEFASKCGWDNDKVNAYISDCVDVLEGTLAQPGKILVPTPSGYLPNISKSGLNPFTMTIPFDDFRRARDVIPNFPNSISEFCASETLGFVFRYGKRLGVKGYQLYFDRNEPFYGHVRDRWISKKARMQIPELKKVLHVGESEMSVSPALQMADLFAWCINHQDNVRRDWHKRVGDLPWGSYILTYEYLMNPTPGALERTAGHYYPPADPEAESDMEMDRRLRG